MGDPKMTEELIFKIVILYRSIQQIIKSQVLIHNDLIRSWLPMNLEVTLFAGSSIVGGGLEATTSPSSTSIGGLKQSPTALVRKEEKASLLREQKAPRCGNLVSWIRETSSSPHGHIQKTEAILSRTPDRGLN